MSSKFLSLGFKSCVDVNVSVSSIIAGYVLAASDRGCSWRRPWLNHKQTQHIMRPLTNGQWPPILLYEYMTSHHGDPVQHTAAMLLHNM